MLDLSPLQWAAFGMGWLIVPAAIFQSVRMLKGTADAPAERPLWWPYGSSSWSAYARAIPAGSFVFAGGWILLLVGLLLPDGEVGTRIILPIFGVLFVMVVVAINVAADGKPAWLVPKNLRVGEHEADSGLNSSRE